MSLQVARQTKTTVKARKLCENPCFKANFKQGFWVKNVICLPITSAGCKIHLNEVICKGLHHHVEYKLDWSSIQQSKYEWWDNHTSMKPPFFSNKTAGVPTVHIAVLRECDCIWPDILCSKKIWAIAKKKKKKRNPYLSGFGETNISKMHSGLSVVLKLDAYVL